jgi:endonuclease/exonuclease/phosphatase family metal-dependent hydrolase
VECAYILSIRQVAGTGELQAFQVASTKYTDIPKTGGYSLTMPYRESKIPLIVASTVETYKWTAEVVEGKDFVTIPELIDVEGQESFDILLAENNTTANRTAKVKIWCQYEDFEQVYEITLNQQLSQYTALQVFAKEDELKVMSFNIWVNRSGEHAWNNRKAACYELINYHRPALIGIQEAMCQWHWRDLVPALRKYGYEGYGLSPYEYVDALISTRGGTSGVFYDKSLFEKLNYGTFWISDTPDVPGSKSWGSGDIRIGTWLILKHKHTGKKICYINTHLDFGDTVQVNSMTLIMQKFEELGKDCDYWISTGDYNMYSYSKGMKPIEGKLKNTRLAAPAGKTDNDRTYNAADPTRPSDPVDHVLCSVDMEVVEYHTIDDSYGVPYVSDHYPVYAIVKL